MVKKEIIVAQIGTGSNVNLLPLAAGQLVSRLKIEKELLEEYDLKEILFKREDPKEVVSRMKDVYVAGFSCFLWNKNHSLAIAEEIKKKFPESLIVLGGPSIPKEDVLVKDFLNKNDYVDVIVLDEGEEVFVNLCKNYSKKDLSKIPGIIYRDKTTNSMIRNNFEKCVSIEDLSSPYLDGTFDYFYNKNSLEFSGIILETNRGCPYSCTYCTWGNQPFKKIREKPLEIVRKEIEWAGKNKINYIAMCDANFGIRERDIDFARELAKCKEKYGYPKFISVSWAKNSPDKVLEIADILKNKDIGFRVTLSLQSLNPEVVKVVKRVNIRREVFDKIKEDYRKNNLYSYTELILGLPMESYDSFVSGIENCLSTSVFDQLYVYPLFLFPNTEIGSEKSRKKYGIKSRMVECVYTKSKIENKIKEEVEIVVGNSAMPEDKWREAFTVAYYTLALHDDRLAFFILNYLKKKFGIKIIEFVTFLRDISKTENLQLIRDSIYLLENRAREVQEKSKDHLIRPRNYNEIPYDPPEGVFLELLLDKDKFYSELLNATKIYLKYQNKNFEEDKINDLFKFQNAIMADLNGPCSEYLDINYNWIDYFAFTFNLNEKDLKCMKSRLKIVDLKPSYGSTKKFLENHFDIRGIPAFNFLYDTKGNLVFPPVKMKNLK